MSKPPRGTAGTEHRDQYRTLYDATVGASSIAKPQFSVGLDKTSSLTGLPWTVGNAVPAPTWVKREWAPVAVAPTTHFRPSSSDYGAVPQASFHKHSAFEKPQPAASVRYLQAPYLSGEMAAGAGIDARPVSSVSTFSLASERQAEILAGGEMRLGERMAHTTSWTMARSMRSAPIGGVPEPYLTSTNASFQQRAAADSQQHRLRGFTTSSFVPERSLNSSPTHMPSSPLDGSTSLHATRYLGVRDSDGSRRLIEVDTTGAPAATAPWKLPAKPPAPPELPQPKKFVSSQPTTHNVDTVRSFMNGEVDTSLTPLPREPLPAECRVTRKHRRPFAMGYRDSFRFHDEYKIRETKKQAELEAAA